MLAARASRAYLTAYARRPTLIAAAWSAVACVAAAQTMAMVRLHGGVDIAAALLQRLSILPLWAVATPAILWSARRYPVLAPDRRPSASHLAMHLALGSLFIVLANVAIRIPAALGAGGVGMTGLARSTLLGLAEFYPLALVVYGVIVAIGHVGRPAADTVPLPAAPTAIGAAASLVDTGDTVPLPVATAIAAHETTPVPQAPEAEMRDAAAAADAVCLPVRQWNRVHLVRIEEIDWIEAEVNYVVVHAGGRSYKGRERIGDVEARLDARRFVRIHRSSIVHVARIREVQPLTHGDHVVILRDGKVLRVARSRRAALEAALAVEL
jgi:hypothetical protein